MKHTQRLFGRRTKQIQIAHRKAVADKQNRFIRKRKTQPVGDGASLKIDRKARHVPPASAASLLVQTDCASRYQDTAPAADHRLSQGARPDRRSHVVQSQPGPVHRAVQSQHAGSLPICWQHSHKMKRPENHQSRREVQVLISQFGIAQNASKPPQTSACIPNRTPLGFRKDGESRSAQTAAEADPQRFTRREHAQDHR